MEPALCDAGFLVKSASRGQECLPPPADSPYEGAAGEDLVIQFALFCRKCLLSEEAVGEEPPVLTVYGNG